MKKTIGELFLNRLKLSPQNPGVGTINNGRIASLNFKKYFEIVEYLSISLVNLGLKPQDKACILSDTRKEWNFFDLAIMCSGSVTVPIYPSYTADEILYILNHSEANFLIVENQQQLEKILTIQSNLQFLQKIVSIEFISENILKKLNSNITYIGPDECKNIGITQRELHPDKFENNIQKLNPESPATIVYTSGTTGKPKGALIRHEALFQVLINVKKFVHNSIDSNDRLLTYLPLSHVLGRLESFLPILLGIEGVYSQDMKKLIQEIPVVRPTVLLAVPRVLEKIYEKAMNDINGNPVKKNVFVWATHIADIYFQTLDSDKTPSTSVILQYQMAKKLVFDKIYSAFGGKIRYLISGGAPLSVKIINFMRNAGFTVLEGYGLTETIAPCFLNPLNFQIPGTVGQPMGDVEVRFAPDHEIQIRSKALFSEYYKDPEATKKVLDEDGWFSTGDIGMFNSKGFLAITDRKKDLIITSGGKNVAPQKIENLLKTEKYIAQSLIIGDQKKYLTALIGIEKEVFEPHFKEFELDQNCDYKDLANHPLVNQYVQTAIENVNHELASFETIKKFRIIPAEVTTQNYLTPSLKLKKKVLMDQYSSLIDAMYN